MKIQDLIDLETIAEPERTVSILRGGQLQIFSPIVSLQGSVQISRLPTGASLNFSGTVAAGDYAFLHVIQSSYVSATSPF